MRKFQRWTTVPLWVQLLHWLMECLDYGVLSPLSSRLVWWRNSLLDHYCRCENCRKRKQAGAS